MATTLAIIQVIAALAGFLRQIFVMKQSADDRPAGRAEAERDEAVAGKAATERELRASQDAPQTTEDAIRRLEDDSA